MEDLGEGEEMVVAGMETGAEVGAMEVMVGSEEAAGTEAVVGPGVGGMAAAAVRQGGERAEGEGWGMEEAERDSAVAVGVVTGLAEAGGLVEVGGLEGVVGSVGVDCNDLAEHNTR